RIESSEANFWATVAASFGSPLSSSTRITTFFPLMPPLALTSSAASWAPSANCLPTWARLPVIGAATPMTRSWAAAGPARPSAAARTRRAPSARNTDIWASSRGSGSRTGEHGVRLEKPPARDDGPNGPRVGQAADRVAGAQGEAGGGAGGDAAEGWPAQRICRGGRRRPEHGGGREPACLEAAELLVEEEPAARLEGVRPGEDAPAEACVVPDEPGVAHAATRPVRKVARSPRAAEEPLAEPLPAVPAARRRQPPRVAVPPDAGRVTPEDRVHPGERGHQVGLVLQHLVPESFQAPGIGAGPEERQHRRALGDAAVAKQPDLGKGVRRFR